MDDDARALGTARFHDREYFATAEQGKRADHAVVPERLINGHSLHEDFDLTPADLGLGNVDDTADADKKFTIEQIEHLRYVLERKVNKGTTVNGHSLEDDVVITRTEMGLGAVANLNPAELTELARKQFDGYYQPASHHLDYLDANFPRSVYDVVASNVSGVRRTLDLDDVDNTSDALKLLRFTRRLDRRYVHQTDTTEIDHYITLSDQITSLQYQLDMVQSELARRVSSLSQLITALSQDPTIGRRTTNVLREVLAELEIEED